MASEHCFVLGFVALLVGLVGVAAWMVALHKQVDRQVDQILSSLGNVHCGSAEEDVEYLTGRSLYQLHNITSEETCRSKCTTDTKCGTWTWGKERGVTGLTDVCFLKQLDLVQMPRKHMRHGVVSELPCQVMRGRTGRIGLNSTGTAGAPNSLRGSDSSVILDTTSRAVPAAASTSTVSTTSTTRTTISTTSTTQRTTAVPTTTTPTTTKATTVTTTTVTTLPTTQAPTTSTANAADSFFCFSLMLPGSYEQTLLYLQYKKKMSIFACHGYEIYSNKSIEVVKGIYTAIVDINLQCKMGGEFYTAMNTGIFIAVWNKVASDGRYAHYGWTVKVDPDTVFFPERLRPIVRQNPETDRGVYLNNCKYGLHGPIEIFSRNAVQSWTSGEGVCDTHFQKQCNGECKWGEDMYIDQCLWKVLRVDRINVFDILVEAHCDPPPGWAECRSERFIAFHPFKKPDLYSTCANNALAMEI
mmetsp:Transcript_30772/g.86786  ORF Transcript_30772/g.86786 Transcript_30772/m.86786 type:complete len:471 (-) Transcript_30772:93-1505(-)